MLKAQYNYGTEFVVNGHFGYLSLDYLLNDYYEAESIRVHYPSEHTFDLVNPNDDTERQELEVQIEHRRIMSKKPLIISFIFEFGSYKSEFIADLISSYQLPLGFTVDIEKIIPGHQKSFKEFFYYSGSYSYPNCTENVD